MEVIFSSKDPAGTLIAKALSECDVESTKTDSGLLYAEQDIDKIKTDFLVFASKHKSESGAPVFTVHVPGNWNAADMGGKPGQISWSDPLGMKSIAVALEKERKRAGIEITVGMEVDHHGPLCTIPCCFTEIGSTETEWNNSKYAAAVAAAITEAKDTQNENSANEIAFCVGGGHYCPAFNKLELGDRIAVAHTLPNYAVDSVAPETFAQAFERTSEEIDVVLIDWRGLKAPQREKVLKLTNEAGAEWRKV